MNDDVPLSPFGDFLGETVREIALHRNNVLKDMIKEFQAGDILQYSLEIVFIDYRGEIEEGRGSGVLKEALSIFWGEFFNSLSTGACEKVPSIRHDYQKQEWESVARVLVAGFKQENYFPITLSKAFVAACFFGEELIPTNWLLESFYQYISRDEHETLEKSVSGKCDPSKDDDVLEVLNSYKCYRRVSKENMQKNNRRVGSPRADSTPKVYCKCLVTNSLKAQGLC